jgi:hypothetical protein
LKAAIPWSLLAILLLVYVIDTVVLSAVVEYGSAVGR